MQLSKEQQQIVADNMGLVGKVIRDKVHNVDQGINYSLEDLFQIGCVGLCKAAATDKGGCFSTYAYRLIWNEICDELIRSSRFERYHCQLKEDGDLTDHTISKEDPCICLLEQKVLLEKVKERAVGSVAKGISCLEMSVQGYTSAEIGKYMHAEAATVRMWMTSARRFLKEQPEIKSCMEEGSV